VSFPAVFILLTLMLNKYISSIYKEGALNQVTGSYLT